MNNKKVYIIGLSIFFGIVLFIILFGVLKKEEKEPSAFDLLEDGSIFSEHIDILIDVTYSDKEKSEVKSENIKTFNTSNNNTKIDLGDLNVLSSSYISLNSEYDLLEILIGDNTDRYLNDNQLSTSYDFCNFYRKKWYVVEKATNTSFLVYEDNLSTLTLNPFIEENNIEADIMIVGGREKDVDHIVIPISDLIARAKQDDLIGIREYSIFVEEYIPNPKDFIKNIEEKIDLDGDSNKETISISFYEGDNEGFTIRINDVSKSFPLNSPCTSVCILDIDKNDNYKELLISGDNSMSEEMVETYIISFIDGEIVKTFHSIYGFNEFVSRRIDNKDFYNYDLNLESDGSLMLTFRVQDSIQNWILRGYYKLNDKHEFELVRNNYFEAIEESIRVATNNVAIVVYSDMDYNTVAKTTIPPGTEVSFIGTTLKFWTVLKIDGNIYYLPIDSKGFIKDLGANCAQAFTGLAIAD